MARPPITELLWGETPSLHGFYYSPSFISFDANPYYGRSQSNSTSSSITDSGGYTSSVSIFGGSHFPGSVSFNQGMDSTGVFGIPGSSGLATKDSSKSFAVGWSFLFPNLPPIAVGYSDGSGTSSVLGSGEQSQSSTQTFSVHSGYRFAGFSMSGGFIHLNTSTNSTGSLDTSGTGNSLDNSSSSSTYNFNVSHRLPLGGSFALGLGRSTYSDNSDGSTNNGTTDNLSATAGINVRTFPISAGLSYSDNLYGAVEEQILANGGSVLQTTLSPTSRALIMTLTTSHTVFNRVYVSGFMVRQEQYIAGQSIGLTQYGANASYNFSKFFKGLVATVGLTDNASQVGNLGANLRANVNYNRNFGRWEFSGNFSYNQNVQTLMAMYTTSTMNYTAQLHRKFPHGISLNLGGGGGHSGFEQQAGNGSQSEGGNVSVAWYRFALGGNYSQSSGSSVLTAGGLVSVTSLPVPIATPNSVVNYSGNGYGFSATAVPLRGLSINASYSKTRSDTIGAALTGQNETDLINAFCAYHFRKVFFNAGVTKFSQNIGASGSAPSMITSYYFGISRWFKFF